MKILIIHQNFPGQYRHLVGALLARGDQVQAIGGPQAPGMPGVPCFRYGLPSAGAVPAVRAQRLNEVIDPRAERYGVKRPFVLKSQKQTVEPGSEFSALIGTGYGTGRALVEIVRYIQR